MSHTTKTSSKYSAHDVFEEVAARISRWEIPAGERLTEQRLSEDFGVSRTPIREALRLLERAGLVEEAPPRGYAVRALDLTTIDQIYTIRMVLEELSVELAAVAVETDGFKELKARVEVASESKEDGASQLREAFHEELAALTGNDELVRALRDIDLRIYAFRRLDLALPQFARAAQDDHLTILELLESRQTPEAKQAMREHIRRSQETVRSLMNAGINSVSFSPVTRGGPRA
jgi:DNA-binding GntR family transcriptional regulator